MRLSFGWAVMGELASYLSVFPLPNFREGGSNRRAFG